MDGAVAAVRAAAERRAVARFVRSSPRPGQEVMGLEGGARAAPLAAALGSGEHLGSERADGLELAERAGALAAQARAAERGGAADHARTSEVDLAIPMSTSRKASGVLDAAAFVTRGTSGYLSWSA